MCVRCWLMIGPKSTDIYETYTNEKVVEAVKKDSAIYKVMQMTHGVQIIEGTISYYLPTPNRKGKGK